MTNTKTEIIKQIKHISKLLKKNYNQNENIKMKPNLKKIINHVFFFFFQRIWYKHGTRL